jgi:hypothetical protein
MRTVMLVLAVAESLLAPLAAQSAGSHALAQVRLPMVVRAGGDVLPGGTYDLRLAPVAGLAGTNAAAQQPVEFVSDGAVVAREVAEVVRDDDLPAIGASAQPAAPGVRVELLKGGEFLRISVKRASVRYLVHLPVVR